MSLHARYFVGEALRAFSRAKWMSLVTVITIGIILFLFSLFGALFWYIHIWIAKGEAKMEMVAFIADEYASLDSAIVLRRQIESYPGVQRAGWVSKDSAMQEFQRLYGTEMLEAVDENPLPASFHIALEEPYRQSDSMAHMQENLDRIVGLEEIGYEKEWFPVLEKIRKYFAVVVVVMFLITVLVLYWIVSNTIRFTLYSRRQNIQIMQLVGATRTFVKIPFYLEGLIAGAMGSGIGFFLLYFTYKFLQPRIPDLTPMGYYGFQFFGIMIIAGVSMSLLSTRTALSKYLK